MRYTQKLDDYVSMPTFCSLKKNSAAGPDGIPAIFPINTREYIKAPLALILRKSLDEGTLPDVLKLAYVTPIYKGGSKMNPENYSSDIKGFLEIPAI